MTRASRSRRVLAAAAACALAAVLCSTASPVHAASDDWWYDLYDVADVHAEGWTGEGVKVAVIDNQINPDLPVFDGRSLTVADGAICEGGQPTNADPTINAIHGSTVTATIIGNGTGAGGVRGIAPDADVTFYGWDTDGSDDCAVAEHADTLSGFGWAVQRALDDGAQIITTSTRTNELLDGDSDVIANAIAKGVIVVSSTSNPSADGVAVVNNLQSRLNGVVAATAVDRDGNLQTTADGEPFIATATTVVAVGAGLPTIGVPDRSWDESTTATGSSFAAPLVAGMLAVVTQKYPDATANQLVQSLIRNTGREPHELEYDAEGGYGYGAAWLTSMLAADPSQYPDENPLMDKDVSPTAEQVAAAAERGSTYPPVEATPDSFGEYDDPPAADDGGGLGIGLVLAIIGGIIVIAVIITIVIVQATRKKKISGGTST